MDMVAEFANQEENSKKIIQALNHIRLCKKLY